MIIDRRNEVTIEKITLIDKGENIELKMVATSYFERC